MLSIFLIVSLLIAVQKNFKRVLLSKCQEEFESNQAKAKKVQARDGLTPEQILELEDEEMRARKKYLGSI